MKRFFQPVDLRSRKAMIDYLEDHFRYFTMNSWNCSQSYACNLKIYKLGLDHEISEKLYDMLDTQEFFYWQKELLDEFAKTHQYRWQAAMNGRSGGYLVLYQGELKPSEYKSYCTHCGQRNYKSVSESGNICGVCRNPSRVDYSHPPMQVNIFPGRGTDDDADYEAWEMYELRERVRLVQEFDQLADRMVDQAIHLAKTSVVEEEEYLIPQRKKVLVSTGA